MVVNIFIIKDLEVNVDENNVENSVEIAGENEMESGVPTISIPIERCTKSHRYLKRFVSSF